MVLVELIPLNKGNRIIVDETSMITIGRRPNVGCLDNRVSRNHAELFIKPNGTLWIRPVHHNPTFYKTKTDQIVSLMKDNEYQLNHNDQFGLLPDDYFYQVSFKIKDDWLDSSSGSKDEPTSAAIGHESATQQKETLIDGKCNISHTSSTSIENRTLPAWMPSTSQSTASSYVNEPNTKPSSTNTPKEEHIDSKEVANHGTLPQDAEDNNDNHISVSSLTSSEQINASNDVSVHAKNQASSTAINSIKRERCAYGAFCYRKHPMHQQLMIHPGDPDWQTEESQEESQNDTSIPQCPYGANCYRKNPDHLNEYSHPTRDPTNTDDKRKKRKRRASEEDDDGLPNEYDYNDSFIDDEDLDDSLSTENAESDRDTEWKPHSKTHKLADTDDDSSVDSEFDLAKQEAAEFIKGSTAENGDRKYKRHHTESEDDQ